MARIGIIGSEGRMGLAIAEVLATGEHECAGGVDRGHDPADVAGHADALVDFSAPDALAENLASARRAGVPILIGTTGLADEHHAALDEAANGIPVLQTGNTSLGVTLLAHLVKEAAARLGPEWDIEVLEMHHRMKVDAPSGTALLLGEAAAEARGVDLAENTESGRDGHIGKRAEGAIGFAALRGGTVAGEHSVIFAGEQERITLAHSAENRSIFARGAVRGAAWLIGKPPGRYTMQDVLGL
ncbi:4-hydroxy-tetrahydrodipicolinate reductase [Aurantiacibacter aquimixticola]|uniref:4-hydroxy-tetrahydrodipicolinate reductase n=1 Tax=Aurantiacibacter aquimixticola TaxID=1958945 RepID=A0A419RU11_9SPHN|nr:4-hydroxy-tetrahydrodipicolinate reductase [Aurantiacibacter aquimixticola]RJY09270.1 4-hydroxy-tetrahydrodipicolinate reductase [Aurantiacibacter aquimixticola]